MRGLPSKWTDDFRPKKPEGLAREAVERRQQRMAMGIQVETCRGDRHLMPHKMHAGFQHILCACKTYMLIDMLVHIYIYIYTYSLQLMKGSTGNNRIACKVQGDAMQFDAMGCNTCIYIYVYSSLMQSNQTEWMYAHVTWYDHIPLGTLRWSHAVVAATRSENTNF